MPDKIFIPPVAPNPDGFVYVNGGFYQTRGYTSDKIHGALDVVAKLGTPIKAIGLGTVTAIKTTGVPGSPRDTAGNLIPPGTKEWRGPAAGNLIYIVHENGMRSEYLHLSKVYVKEGQKVSEGQFIGESGNTGTDTPHLHLYLRGRNNSESVNPLEYIKGNWKIAEGAFATTDRNITIEGDNVTDGTTGYIKETYEDPYADNRKAAIDVLIPVLKKEDIVSETNLVGELELIRLLTAHNAEQQAIVNKVATSVSGFGAIGRSVLIGKNLIAVDADAMRNALASNMYSDTNFTYTHAWRAPGKLAVTATITTPGMAGFRIGQIFWIDRIAENYKTGAFQLFGLTERIDINKGWTTELYSRFNAIPKNSMTNVIDYTEYRKEKKITPQSVSRTLKLNSGY